jgi:sterol O-acyltransferase
LIRRKSLSNDFLTLASWAGQIVSFIRIGGIVHHSMSSHEDGTSLSTHFFCDMFVSVSLSVSLVQIIDLVLMTVISFIDTSTMTTYRFSKFQAAFTTFLLSALVHELVMAVVTKKIRLYLFLSQMLQLPMIMVGRHKFFKQYPGLGNLVFWLGLMSGFPLLAVSYLRH